MNTIWSIWNTLVAETPIETNANPMPSKVSADPIVQSVSIKKPSSYVGAAVGSEPETSKSKANFRSLFSENVCEGAKFSIPRKVVETVSTRFDHTLYGYLIGKHIAFPVMEYYARLDDNMENGPWMIRNSTSILKKSSMDTRLCKEELTRIPVWVKIHDVPIQDVLKESLTISVPLIEGTGYTIETVTIEYEWNPLDVTYKTNDGFQTVGKKKKKGKSKSTNGGQFVGPSVKQNIRYEPKETTSAPKNGATNAGNASKSSSMLKTIGTSSEKGKFTTSNSYSALDDESEEDVENVYDELANLFPNSKTGGSSSFKAAAG
ncbi:zinc knuckle CX2CX4HX4C containing protein [Tanacetum coccineum]